MFFALLVSSVCLLSSDRDAGAYRSAVQFRHIEKSFLLNLILTLSAYFTFPFENMFADLLLRLCFSG